MSPLIAEFEDPRAQHFFEWCGCPLFMTWCPFAYLLIRAFCRRMAERNDSGLLGVFGGTFVTTLAGAISLGGFVAVLQMLLSGDTKDYKFKPMDNLSQWLLFAGTGGLFGFVFGLGFALKFHDYKIVRERVVVNLNQSTSENNERDATGTKS